MTIGGNEEPPLYEKMDVVPVTEEESLTPNKVEMIGDEDKNLEQSNTDLPQSSFEDTTNKGNTSPTQDSSKPNQNEKVDVEDPSKIQNNTTGDVEPSVTME